MFEITVSPVLCYALTLLVIVLAIFNKQLRRELFLTQQSKKKLQMFETIIQQANESIIITNAELDLPGPKIIFVNSAFTKLTGYTAEEVLGKNPRILQGPKTDHSVLDQLRQKLKQGEPFSGEAINYTKSGTEFYMEWLVGPVRNETQQITHFFAIQRDVTKRKQAEQVLQQALDKLEDLNQLKDDFLSTISHELRTPVANMKMAIRMLKLAINRESRGAHLSPNCNHDKVAQYLRILEDECQRESDLINDLLDLQRLEAKLWSACPEAIELERWLPDIIRPFEQRIRERQQILQVSISEQIPALISDRSSLERIVSELINNACKYTPPTEKITVTAETKLESIRLQVINSGVEISPMELTKIFDKFYRIPRVDCWKEGGTGLGLALVKELTESLRGTLKVESAYNKTCFTVELPLIPLCPIDNGN